MNAKKVMILAVHALVGWALCGAIIGIGFSLWSVETTLIVHLLGAPVVFLLVSGVYFNWFGYTNPLQTAVIFVAAAILLDFFVVALMVMKSMEMFTSLIGTWIPWALIFVTTYVVGTVVNQRKIRSSTGEAPA